MNNISGEIRSHPTTSKQSHLFDYDNSPNFLTIPETQVTLTDEMNCTLNPFYTCGCRRGYGPTNDPFNVWKLQEEVNHYSKGDIKRAYRLGDGF